MSEDRIDFSALDPARDPVDWERRIARVASEGLARHQRPMGAFAQVQAWLRPAVAIAAFLALLAWGVALLAPGGGTLRPSPEGVRGLASTSDGDEPALVLARWATQDARPAPSEILNVLGGSHAAQ